MLATLGDKKEAQLNSKELFVIVNSLDGFTELESPEIDKLIDVASRFGKSWSGSWLGYHSRVYYDRFQIPPSGAVFSQEWGFKDAYNMGSRGAWHEYRFDDVISAIEQEAGDPTLDSYIKNSKAAAEAFEDAKSSCLSLVHSSLNLDDKFSNGIIEKIEAAKILDEDDFIEYWKPSGRLISRDMAAIEKGLVVPPHFLVLANAHAIKFPYQACEELRKLIIKLANHVKNIEGKSVKEERIGTNIFIGHGRSPHWRELKDFVSDRLGLPWDEFNRVPVAGVTNITRLAQMLEQASFAFLVMTAEDELADGNHHARMNVVHEVGLFQGRLGFERAIVLLEDGCEEFSNIQGLGQIRFPKGNISAIFEDVRTVLEREGIAE